MGPGLTAETRAPKASADANRMVAREPNGEIERDAGEGGDGEGVDVEAIKDVAGFVFRSALRRPKLAGTVFGIVAILGVTAAETMPRTYNASVKLLAQRSSMIRALSSSNRDVSQVDNPTKNVADLIMRRDNLVSLSKQSDLVDRYYAARPAPLKFKDSVSAWVSGPMSDEDRLRSLVGMLEGRLVVTADAETVNISVDWPNPTLAYELATLVQKNFLEARYDNDVALITDSIAVLQDHAKMQLTQVDAALNEYQRVFADRTAFPEGQAPAPTTPHSASVVGPRAFPRASALAAPTAVDPDVASALEAKRLQIRALEAERQRMLDTAREQLGQAQLTLTPMHPTVIALQQKVDALSQPSLELPQLKSEERAIMAQLVPTGSGSATGAAPAAARTFPGLAAPVAAAADDPQPAPKQPLSLAEDGPTQLARSKLEASIRGYEDVMARIDAANIELDITRTAFKYRYTVVTPAEVPKKPKKPIAMIIGVGSVLAAGLLALLFSAAADLGSGLILESWEVRRRLKLEVLGELDLPL